MVVREPDDQYDPLKSEMPAGARRGAAFLHRVETSTAKIEMAGVRVQFLNSSELAMLAMRGTGRVPFRMLRYQLLSLNQLRPA